MKTISNSIIYFAALLAAVMVCSCQKQTVEPKNDNAISSVTATIALATDETKTSMGDKIGDEYPILWTAGDAIAVSNQTSAEKVKFTLKAESAGKQKGEFESTSPAPADPVYAYYPFGNVTAVSSGTYTVTIPATQTYSENSIPNGSMPMYGKANLLKDGIVFEPMFAVLKLQLKGDCQVSRIVVTSDTEILSGTATVNMENGEVSFTEGEKSVELVCQTPVQLNESTAEIFHISIPAAASKNYKVYIVTSGSQVMVQSTTGKTFKAGVIKKMAALTFTPIMYPGTSIPALAVGKTIWAPVNVGYSDINDITRNGILYQFGRKVGCYFDQTEQPYGQTAVAGTTQSPADQYFYVPGNSINDWYSSTLEGQLSEWPMTGDGAIGNPCPEGWFVPTLDEFGSLCYTDWNPSTHTGTSQRSGQAVNGGWQFNLGNGVSLVFPASGSRNGKVSGAPFGQKISGQMAGTYWTSTVVPSSCNVYSMVAAPDFGVYGTIIENSRCDGFSVRAVMRME